MASIAPTVRHSRWYGSARKAPRGHAALDGLAGPPVLAVRDVPELHGVAWVEALALQGLGREEPLAHDARPVRPQRLEPVGQDVVGVRADQEVREQRAVQHLAPAAVVEAGKDDAEALAGEGHRPGVVHQL